METRANYVLIGAFTLAGFLGIFAFFFWFANLQLDRQFAYYDIDFSSVSGLSDASDVRFSGFPVGQVVDVRLSPNRDGQVRVRIEVDADTPVRTDSVATIEAQGVTGVSFVGLSAGSPDAPMLTAQSTADVPMIQAGQSALQALTQDAPQILSETLEVVQALNDLIGDENQNRVETILENVEVASGSFSQALTDFSAVTGAVSGFAAQIDQFNTTLEALTSDASDVFAAVETTLASIDALSSDAQGTLAEGSALLAQATTTIATADQFLASDLPAATAELSGAVAAIETQFSALSTQAEALMTTYAAAGAAANARLNEVEGTLEDADALIAQIDATLQSVDQAANRFDGFMVDSAEPLVDALLVATADANAVIESIGTTVATDVPEILQAVQEASQNAAAVIETVGADVSSASGRLDALTVEAADTLAAAQVTFANANSTLGAVNAALETGDRALVAAEAAFSGADRIINEEAEAIAAQLRATLAELEVTIGAVADQVPAVAEDLRAASRSAEVTLRQIAEAVDQSAPGVQDFAQTALPQYARLAVEGRALLDNLDALIEQIQRDPSRFFLNPRAPEFRR